MLDRGCEVISKSNVGRVWINIKGEQKFVTSSSLSDSILQLIIITQLQHRYGKLQTKYV